MALTPSTMLALGTSAPEFQLPDTVSGNAVSLDSFADKKGLLVMFICNHCPFVKHINDGLVHLGRDYANSDLGIVAINANDVDTHPDDSPDKMKANAENLGYVFPYCFDETQSVAKAYAAACTPDFFLFDGSRKLVYRGQLDGSRPGNEVAVTGKDLRAAISAVLAGSTVSHQQQPSVGCNIKWKAGNEPDYWNH